MMQNFAGISVVISPNRVAAAACQHLASTSPYTKTLGRTLTSPRFSRSSKNTYFGLQRPYRTGRSSVILSTSDRPCKLTGAHLCQMTRLGRLSVVTYVDAVLLMSWHLSDNIVTSVYFFVGKLRILSKIMAIDLVAVHNFKGTLSDNADVVTRESDNYEASIKRWSAAAEKPAGIIVFPTTPNDVSKAVLFSKAQGLELAVVGGGHGTSGASSTDGGLCIDLSKMRAVTVDEKAKTLSVEGGALWGDVDKEAAKFGLAAVGGTVNHTGVGGLTLGGGYGLLTPEYGMVIDNLLEVEVVLADGNIVNASSSENPDLFWAARGAGIGFGVFTKFVYQAHDQKGPVWGGMMVFPREKLDSLITFANKEIQDENGKSALFLGFAAPPPAFQPVVMAVVFYNGTEEEGNSHFKDVLELGPLINQTSEMPYTSVNEMLNPAMFHGLRRTTKGSAFLIPLKPKFADSIFDDWVEFITQNPDADATMVLWEFVPYKRILEISQTATSFANRGAYGNLLFGPGWTKPENDKICREWTRTMSTKTRAELENNISKGTDDTTKTSVGEYANYDSLGASGQTVFGVNFPRLAELKKKYDPQNVFAMGPSLVV
ncbi:hypothetical protein VTL71DRAFT_10918 [Oculimacula yallundae]|uniref:FAD-binding PCMH-type domain-containing protein n=1 Tax=Oculimacula yallundae TaxID=86028 RepID=A0ABR4CVI3_9HELO